jgi:4-hydroxy-4-methyl-2-oxoglutarate aldolase
VEKPLGAEQLEDLRKITTPTLINAIETFDVQPRNKGFMNTQIRCIFPELGSMVGYAVTAKLVANEPAREEHAGLNHEMWKLILNTPAPRVVVIEDADDPPCIGSMWGEVNATIHKALGCVGVVTSGGVRDLDEVRAMGFHFFAAHVIPSHAYEHLIEIGKPVTVGGLIVNPGDLLHADQHGVIVIPSEISHEVAERAHEVEQNERNIINFFRSSDFSPENFIKYQH